MTLAIARLACAGKGGKHQALDHEDQPERGQEIAPCPSARR